MNIATRVIAFWLGYAGIFIVLGLFVRMVPPAARLLLVGTLVTLGSFALTYALAKSDAIAWTR